MSKMVASAKIGETLNPQVTALAKLGLTDKEIKQILADDKRIDKGEKLFELTAEQSKTSKQARIVPRTPTAYNFTKRERKADNDKRELIDLLVKTVSNQQGCVLLEITNQEREFLFTYNDRKFKIVLSAPRS